MIPDLGKYADVVLASYGVTILLVAALVAVSLWQGGRVRAALRAVEARTGGAQTGGGQTGGADE